MNKPQSGTNFNGLGVFSNKNKVYLFYKYLLSDGVFLGLDTSSDGLNFKKEIKNPLILDFKNTKEANQDLSKFKISESTYSNILTYKSLVGKKYFLNCALSLDLFAFKKLGKIDNLSETGIIVPDYSHHGSYLMFFGEEKIKVAFSKNLLDWNVEKNSILNPRENYFDNANLEPALITSLNEGILLVYFVKKKHGETIKYLIGAALFDKNDFRNLLWRSHRPIWEQADEWKGKKIIPIGMVVFNKRLISYWQEGKHIFAVTHPHIKDILHIKTHRAHVALNKFKENPIIKPISHHFWESKATFNSAAFYENNKVHFVYRAVGHNDTSVLGYASSSDGINIDERLNKPIYVPQEDFEHNGLPYASHKFISGGGFGGCEDPRITKLEDKLYMTYVAFDGWRPPRVALTSIKVDDFLNKKFNWEKPVLISEPGIVNKNACILPEKINGKHFIFHRVYPDILIDLVDDLDFNGSKFLEGHFRIKPRQEYWDSRKIGAGPPPIRTKDGWLLIYQAVGEQDPSRYKIGAMLLDLNDPTRVLHRSRDPVLEPTEHYENEGHKFGVAYPCGAVVINNRLLVYYGGADMVVCAAEANLDEFTNHLKKTEKASLKPVKIRSFVS